MSMLKWWYSTNSLNCFRFRIGTMTAVLLEAQEDSSYKLARFRWWRHHDSFSTVKILSISAWTIALSLALNMLGLWELSFLSRSLVIFCFRSPFIALRPTNKHLEEAVSAALAMAIVEPTSMLCFFIKPAQEPSWPASCVCMDADDWFQISGLTFSVRRQLTRHSRNIDLAFVLSTSALNLAYWPADNIPRRAD